jgi:hypothetical protein
MLVLALLAPRRRVGASLCLALVKKTWPLARWASTRTHGSSGHERGRYYKFARAVSVVVTN